MELSFAEDGSVSPIKTIENEADAKDYGLKGEKDSSKTLLNHRMVCFMISGILTRSTFILRMGAVIERNIIRSI